MKQFLIDYFKALKAEIFKLKRTLALLMIFVAPSIIIILFLARGLEAGDVATFADPWKQFISQSFFVWSVLMLTLFITLQTFLMANVDVRSEMQKLLKTLPINYNSIVLGKITITTLVVIATNIVLGIEIFLFGLVGKVIFNAPKLDLQYFNLGTLISYIALTSVLALGIVAIHSFVANHWPNIVVPFGFGIGVTMLSFIGMNTKIGEYLPWISLTRSLGPNPNVNVAIAIGVSLLLFLIFSIATGIDASRKEL